MRWIVAMQEHEAERRLWRWTWQAGLLALVPAAAALLFNAVRPEGLPLIADTNYHDEILVPCPENVREARAVALIELPPDLAGLTVIDARTAGEYLAGHIPGALSIPHRSLHSADEAFRRLLAEDLAPLRGTPGNRILVCGDEQTSSGRDFASVLLENGFEGVQFLIGGCAAWEAEGNAFERSATGASGVAVGELPADLSGLTVVDARFSRNFRRSHIPGALSVPYRMLSGPEDEKLQPIRDVPGDRVLVYGSEARSEGKDLAEVLVASGWGGARFLEGGFEAWEAAGRPVEGAAAEGAETEAQDGGGAADDAVVADGGGAP
ncbi:MAG: rhodanese-like domain-containing protein [Deltaproteobacteria bacterium]|nr:rhodanese-like domain-containing protein [Deltaproteobacteria bacterium]